MFTLVARAGTGIESFADIRGKRVAIGTRESGTRATMDLLMKSSGIAPTDLARAAELRFVDLVPALCDDRIDAFVLVGGHPNSIVADAAASCDTKIVAVAGPNVDALLATYPYYVPAEVPGGLSIEARTPLARPSASRPRSSPAPTWATPRPMRCVKAIFENFDDFRKLHPALASATRRSAMVGDTAPVHPGALRYFKEVGLE